MVHAPPNLAVLRVGEGISSISDFASGRACADQRRSYGSGSHDAQSATAGELYRAALRTRPILGQDYFPPRLSGPQLIEEATCEAREPKEFLASTRAGSEGVGAFDFLLNVAMRK
jgi:hypothetical protein